MTHTLDWVIPHRKTAGAISMSSAGTNPWILNEWNEGFLFIRLRVSAPPRGKRYKSSGGDLAPDACQAQRKEQDAPPLLQANLAGRAAFRQQLYQDSPRTKELFGLVLFFFFLSHTGGCNVKAIPRPQSAYFKYPISSLLCQGGLYIFHKVSKYAFREKIFPWLQILLMPSNCLCNSASTELMKWEEVIKWNDGWVFDVKFLFYTWDPWELSQVARDAVQVCILHEDYTPLLILWVFAAALCTEVALVQFCDCSYSICCCALISHVRKHTCYANRSLTHTAGMGMKV